MIYDIMIKTKLNLSEVTKELKWHKGNLFLTKKFSWNKDIVYVSG